MRYRNPDPMEKKQAEELKNRLIILIHETVDERIKKAGYESDSILARELRQDVYRELATILRIQSLQISFADTGVHELSQYDNRNRNEK